MCARRGAWQPLAAGKETADLYEAHIDYHTGGKGQSEKRVEKKILGIVSCALVSEVAGWVRCGGRSAGLSIEMTPPRSLEDSGTTGLCC